MLYIDQFGNKFYASTVRELRRQIGNGNSRVSIMYHDTLAGGSERVGYVVGQHWLTAYVPATQVDQLRARVTQLQATVDRF